MPENCIAIFDIGKTNKKVLLFNQILEVVYQKEQTFDTSIDEDRNPCEDIDLLTAWIKETLSGLIKKKNYLIRAINFSTYGASLVFIDKKGSPLTPLFDYLKEVPEKYANELFERYGGQTEFCRQTASPALGKLLNSGVQLRWVHERFPKVFDNLTGILHFPQYLSFLFTGNILSEFTSIGCHTFLWDFDKQQYHRWLTDDGITLPKPEKNTFTQHTTFQGSKILVGTGIHDSSASLVPYQMASPKNFVLVSTGTWCINMNPFNHTPLTKVQLENDCLSFLSITQKPVKASRFFMGHIHDVNVKRLCAHFGLPDDAYKKVAANELVINKLQSNKATARFFKKGMPNDYTDNTIDFNHFTSFEEAYHLLMYDITALNSRAMNRIMENADSIASIYVSGGFARNELFMRLLATFYPEKQVYTSQVDNASALGAALSVYHAAFSCSKPPLDLHLTEWKAFNLHKKNVAKNGLGTEYK